MGVFELIGAALERLGAGLGSICGDDCRVARLRERRRYLLKQRAAAVRRKYAVKPRRRNDD